MDNNLVYDLFNQGNEYFDKGDYDKALDNFEKSLTISNEKEEKAMITRNCNRIGAVYFEIGNYEEAEKYIIKSLNLHKELGEHVHASLTTAHLYLCYKHLNKEYDKSELNNFINNFKINDIPDRDNFILYQILDNKFCLRAAYNQIQAKADSMDNEIKKRFLNYPNSKKIIDAFKSIDD